MINFMRSTYVSTVSFTPCVIVEQEDLTIHQDFSSERHYSLW